MSHQLGQSVERNGCSHAVAKAMTQIVWTHIMELRQLRIFFDEIA